MKNRTKFVSIIPIFVILFVVFLLIGVEFSLRRQQPAPETILIKVLKSDGKTPEINATCKADIIARKGSIEDKPLMKIESLYDYVDINKITILDNKGYYKLDTGLNDYRGNFEIKIVCISSGNAGVSYTILNNTNLPCEIKEKGFLIC